MTAGPQGICPLCQREVARAVLCAHIAAEHPRLRHHTIKLIQAYHPWWQEQDGACWPCWKSYRDATQALNLLKLASPAPMI